MNDERRMMNADLREAVAHLCAGGLLIYPTETAYALGGDAIHPRAVAAIFRVKGRSRAKSLPLIVSSAAMAQRYVRLTPLARKLAARYWPGPFTMVLVARRAFPRGVVAPDGSIALRVSSHPIARALAQQLGRPIVATSANASGRPTCASARAALRSLGTYAYIMMVNGGALPRRRPSTIVDARGARPIVLRRGAIRV